MNRALHGSGGALEVRGTCIAKGCLVCCNASSLYGPGSVACGTETWVSSPLCVSPSRPERPWERTEPLCRSARTGGRLQRALDAGRVDTNWLGPSWDQQKLQGERRVRGSAQCGDTALLTRAHLQKQLMVLHYLCVKLALFFHSCNRKRLANEYSVLQ